MTQARRARTGGGVDERGTHGWQGGEVRPHGRQGGEDGHTRVVILTTGDHHETLF